ncbi:MAG: alpha/beta hydrolase [Lentisphaeria bacterium]
MNILRDLAYAPQHGVCGSGDLYLPKPGSRPPGAALAIHGGGWSELDRSSFAGVAEFLCSELGLMTFNIDYRLSRIAPWPACGDDCLAAAGFLRSVLLPQYCPENVPRVFVVGGSAGGHLALMTGLRLLPEWVAGIVSISGIADPAPDMILHRERYQTLFGKKNAPELLPAISPINFLQTNSPRILCTHTRFDEVVPFAAVQNFVDQACRKGIRIHTYFYSRKNEGHCIWVPGSEPHKLHPDLEEAIRNFCQIGDEAPINPRHDC